MLRVLHRCAYTTTDACDHPPGLVGGRLSLCLLPAAGTHACACALSKGVAEISAKRLGRLRKGGHHLGVRGRNIDALAGVFL